MWLGWCADAGWGVGGGCARGAGSGSDGGLLAALVAAADACAFGAAAEPATHGCAVAVVGARPAGRQDDPTEGVKGAGACAQGEVEAGAALAQDWFVGVAQVFAAGLLDELFEEVLGEEVFGLFAHGGEFADSCGVADQLEHQCEQRPHALKRRGVGVHQCCCGVGHVGEYARGGWAVG